MIQNFLPNFIESFNFFQFEQHNSKWINFQMPVDLDQTPILIVNQLYPHLNFTYLLNVTLFHRSQLCKAICIHLWVLMMVTIEEFQMIFVFSIKIKLKKRENKKKIRNRIWKNLFIYAQHRKQFGKFLGNKKCGVFLES